jgi:hypothetical protein
VLLLLLLLLPCSCYCRCHVAAAAAAAVLLLLLMVLLLIVLLLLLLHSSPTSRPQLRGLQPFLLATLGSLSPQKVSLPVLLQNLDTQMSASASSSAMC